jgi:thioesterase domain-containing protein
MTARLPNYAVPGHIVFLPKLPLTGNGKVDRRALPKPEVREESLPGGGPITPMECRLERLFAQALKRQAVGAEEVFQEAGGDSLMVMELIELASRDGLALYPETIIRNPTVRKLAAFLEPDAVKQRAMVGAEDKESPISVLREAEGGGRLFLCHSTPGDVLGYGNLVHALGEGISVYGFSSLGLQDPERAHGTIEEMAAYYVEHLLKRFPEGPYHLAGWCYGGTVAHEMAAQLARAGHRVGLVGLIDTYAHVPAGSLGMVRWRLRQVGCLFRQGPVRWFSYLGTRMGWGAPPYVEPASPGGTNQRVANRDVVRDKNMVAIWRYHGMRHTGLLTLYLSRRVAPQNVFDPEGAWPLFPGETEVHIIEASHRDILKPPAVEEVAKLMRRRLLGE